MKRSALQWSIVPRETRPCTPGHCFTWNIRPFGLPVIVPRETHRAFLCPFHVERLRVRNPSVSRETLAAAASLFHVKRLI